MTSSLSPYLPCLLICTSSVLIRWNCLDIPLTSKLTTFSILQTGLTKWFKIQVFNPQIVRRTTYFPVSWSSSDSPTMSPGPFSRVCGPIPTTFGVPSFVLTYLNVSYKFSFLPSQPLTSTWLTDLVRVVRLSVSWGSEPLIFLSSCGSSYLPKPLPSSTVPSSCTCFLYSNEKINPPCTRLCSLITDHREFLTLRWSLCLFVF